MSDALSGIDSLYSNNTYTNSVTNNKTNSLENTLTNTDLSNASSDELMTVCKNFEEYFVEQMVKSMVKMANISGEEDANDYSSIFGMSSGGSGSDSGMSTMTSYYGDQMVSMLSQNLCDTSNGKGLGLAQTLYEQMKRNYGITDDTTSSTDKTENNASDSAQNTTKVEAAGAAQ